jgi:hypothetical protein
MTARRTRRPDPIDDDPSDFEGETEWENYASARETEPAVRPPSLFLDAGDVDLRELPYDQVPEVARMNGLAFHQALARGDVFDAAEWTHDAERGDPRGRHTSAFCVFPIFGTHARAVADRLCERRGDDLARGARWPYWATFYTSVRRDGAGPQIVALVPMAGEFASKQHAALWRFVLSGLRETAHPHKIMTHYAFDGRIVPLTINSRAFVRQHVGNLAPAGRFATLPGRLFRPCDDLAPDVFKAMVAGRLTFAAWRTLVGV